jgi:hypothetical protein
MLPCRAAASLLLLHYSNGQERQRAVLPDESRLVSVSPDGVPDRHRRKAPELAGDFESRSLEAKFM